jgi:hypothetical protein
MLDIKECRKIKRDYTKNNENKTIIINVENYPLCYMIITHGNGKSWGYFFNNNEYIFLGTSNQKVIDANLEIRDYNAFSDDYELELIGGNDAVKRMYSRLIDSIDRRYCWCRNWRGSNDLKRAFRINPVLLANLVDCNVLRGRGIYNDPFDHLDRLNYYINDFDYTKPLIKDACKMPVKWLKFLFDYRAQVDYVNLLKKYNYSVDELYKDQYRWYTTEIPRELIPNMEAGLKYASDFLYRDYYNMQRQLSDESKRQFPILPKDIKKYHDRVLPIYNREQAYRKEKELSEKQKRYATDFYEKAVKYNYSDDTYSIKACEKLVDLLVEGSSLHHCVGSYVNSVSTGKEYILFLRKNSDPDTPYFTIDLTPEKHVRQIHGLCNCNITEEIKPFIQSWAKKFKLNLEGCSGVYCALH